MAEIPTRYLVHTIAVDPYTGSGAYGDTYATKVENVRCMKDDTRKLVRGSDGQGGSTGDEVISSTTLYMRLAHQPSFPPGSLVYLPDRVATVITVAPRTDGDLGAWQHLQVQLT